MTLPFPVNTLQIVSGGQTGADRAALDWALARGVAHGGWCPKGRRAEDGQIPPQYLLTETPQRSYLQRTEWNLRDSDATVVFTLEDRLDGGTLRTVEFAERHGRPWLHLRPAMDAKYLARFVAAHGVRVLNVAGKRGSSAPGIESFVQATLERSFSPAASSPLAP